MRSSALSSDSNPNSPLYASPQKRTIHAHTLGNQLSLTDPIVKDLTPSLNITFDNYIYPTVVNTDKNTLLEAYRPEIKGHLESRVAAFLQQSIVVYGSKLNIESLGASDQGASAKFFYLQETESRSKEKVVRQAAHNSTNPCLVFSSTENPTLKRIFLAGTDYYKWQNATQNLPKWVNDADREIDEKTRFSLLRKKSTLLLNRLSQEELTPHEAIVEFVDLAIEEVTSAKNRLEEEQKSPEVQHVLSLYLHYLMKYKTSFELDYSLLDLLIGIKIEDESLRESILKNYYTLIRQAQLKQADLAQRVEAVKSDILKDFRRQPPHIEAALLTLTIESAPSALDKKQLCKLFNFSPTNFRAQLSSKSLSLFDQTKGKLASQSSRISKLAKELLEKMRQYHQEEVEGRGDILRTLRHEKGLTQQKLADKIRSKKISRTALSKMENGHQKIEEFEAKKISSALQVPLSLFVTNFFYSP